MKAKLNNQVRFKAASLNDGVVVKVPEKDTGMYTIQFDSGNTIRCTHQYFEVKNGRNSKEQ